MGRLGRSAKSRRASPKAWDFLGPYGQNCCQKVMAEEERERIVRHEQDSFAITVFFSGTSSIVR